MKKLLLVLVLIGVGLVVTATLVEKWSHNGSPLPRREDYKPLAVKRGRIVDAVNVTGVFQPKGVAVVGSELSGKVVEIYPQAEVNRAVKVNEPLLRLDDRLAQGKLEQARRAVDLADADIARSSALLDVARLAHEKQEELVLKKQVGFRRDLDRTASELKAAEAVLKAAKARKAEAQAAQALAQLGVDMTTLVSPVAGTIIDRKVTLGQTLSPLSATPLFTIASDLGHMELLAQVAEGDVGKVRVGQRATFTINAPAAGDAATDNKPLAFSGRVEQIRPVPANVQGAVYYTAVIDVDNKQDPESHDWLLRPGMPVSVDIIRREHADTWLLPTEALEFKLDEHYQTAEAKKKLQAWERQGESDGRQGWRRVWILDQDDKPWPAFVRIGGTNARGETALRGSEDAGDRGAGGGEYQEVLEWDPDPKVQEKLKSGDPARYPEVITDAPPVQKKGFFEIPKIPRLF